MQVGCSLFRSKSVSLRLAGPLDMEQAKKKKECTAESRSKRRS